LVAAARDVTLWEGGLTNVNKKKVEGIEEIPVHVYMYKYVCMCMYI